MLSWICLLIYFRQIPKFGLYVLMVTHVIRTFLEFLAVLGIFLMSFATGFLMLIGNQVFFRRLGRSLVSTMVMMVGEFEYKDKFLGILSQYNKF